MTSHHTRQVKMFEFGKNWSSFSQTVSEEKIRHSETKLKSLVGDLCGKTFLDIGCGSGLHTLAALRLGARSVLAIDVDQYSTNTAATLLNTHAESENYIIKTMSVFDLSPLEHGYFDVVYSWGVLHHTGDLPRALRSAAGMCIDGGLFAFSLYRRTWLDWFWKLEKRWYMSTSATNQKIARDYYIRAFKVACFLSRLSFQDYVASYEEKRGMDFYHDVHDWLGGYPYESISHEEVECIMRSLGFSMKVANVRSGIKYRIGLFGSGCDEYVYQNDHRFRCRF